MSDSLRPHRLYSPWNSPGQNTGVGSCSLLQGIFQTQRLNPGLPHCRRILYHLSHQGSSRILEWVAYPFSRGSSPPRNRTGVSCIAQILYQLSYQGNPRTKAFKKQLALLQGGPSLQSAVLFAGAEGCFSLKVWIPEPLYLPRQSFCLKSTSLVAQMIRSLPAMQETQV